LDLKPINEIRNRREFDEAFQGAMSDAHKNLRALWHYEKEQNLPKTYLVEFHPKNDHCLCHSWGPGEVFSTLAQTGELYSSTVSRTEDETLLFLTHQDAENKAEFIVDCLDPRFLAFHTLSNVTSSDRFILERLTRYQPEFDPFWFPVRLLEQVANREMITGWQVQYEPLVAVEATGGGAAVPFGTSEELEDVEEIDGEVAPRSLRRLGISIDLEGPRAFETYKALRDIPELLPDMPLNSVLAERADERLEAYARARIKSNGKITGRGPDFSAYLQIVNATLDSYATAIRRLEAAYWLKLDGERIDDGLNITLTGEPFCLTFSRPIEPEKLIHAMFNCRAPFRLMGELRQLGGDYFAVNAIDLHVNQPVGFEIAPKLMRIYLYEGTCGNTLTRIVRSLQHFVDSKLRHPPLGNA
jgi:hypothetical protein